MTTTRCTTFATTVWVIDRVHDNSTHRWPHASPATSAGLAELAEIVFPVTDLANCCATVDMNLAHFT